jgi:single-strand DNA-binding protein
MTVRNSITLIGNVGQLPITKTLPSGTRVIEFSLATNDSYRNRDGEKIQRTEWHSIKAYGKVVDVLERYVSRGSSLAITGTLRYNKWTDKYDQVRNSAEIILEEFTFLDSKNPSAGEYKAEDTVMAAAEPSPKKTSKRRAKKSKSTPTESGERAMTAADDLPF